MRSNRKKRRQSHIKLLEAKLKDEQTLRTETTKKLTCTKLCLGVSGRGGNGSCKREKSVWNVKTYDLVGLPMIKFVR